MPADPHGYLELLTILKRIEAEVRGASDTNAAEALATASKFATGSPSEFLGEARLALRSVLSSGVSLSAETSELIRRAIEDINEGFRRVGG